MPASAIYDIEIYDATHDLVVGTQGRGVYVLDDIAPLERTAASQSTAFRLEPPRDAYRYFLPAPYTTAGAGDFVGENAPYGAVLDIYAPRVTTGARIDVFDSGGSKVRSISVGDLHPGFNRVVWDLRTDGPVLWKYTAANNTGPTEGPEIVPGSYVVKLAGGGGVQQQPLTVRTIAGDGETQAQYEARYEFLKGLFSDLSAVNARLNEIDACLPSNCADRSQASTLRTVLTAGYRSQLQMVMVQPRLRERILALIERVGTSEAPPTQAQLDEAALLRQSLQRALAT
jgi:hypothetical protein